MSAEKLFQNLSGADRLIARRAFPSMVHLGEGAPNARRRVPIESEWEYVARAGPATPVWDGECIHTDMTNYDGTKDDHNGCGAKTGFERDETVPAGSLPTYPWGLHEVAGNVWEWVEDCWHESYEGEPTRDPSWRLEFLRVRGQLYDLTLADTRLAKRRRWISSRPGQIILCTLSSYAFHFFTPGSRVEPWPRYSPRPRIPATLSLQVRPAVILI